MPDVPAVTELAWIGVHPLPVCVLMRRGSAAGGDVIGKADFAFAGLPALVSFGCHVFLEVRLFEIVRVTAHDAAFPAGIQIAEAEWILFVIVEAKRLFDLQEEAA